MRSWLAKFKISTALDRGASRKPQKGPEEVRRFDESIRILGERLRSASSEESVPPSLHANIMRSVRASKRGHRPSLQVYVLRWLPVPALALLLIAIVWRSSNRSGGETGMADSAKAAPPLTGVGAAWEEGREFTHTAPVAALAPLSGEMELLNRDLHRAVAFIAGSLP